MLLEAVIQRGWRCNEMTWSCEFGGCNRVSLQKDFGLHDHANFDAVFELVWRYTWMPTSGERQDWLRGSDGAIVQMHMDANIMQTWMLSWSQFAETLGGCHKVRLEESWEVVNGRCTGWWWKSIHQLVNSQPWECDKVTIPLNSHEELAGGSRSSREAHQNLKLHL